MNFFNQLLHFQHHLHKMEHPSLLSTKVGILAVTGALMATYFYKRAGRHVQVKTPEPCRVQRLIDETMRVIIEMREMSDDETMRVIIEMRELSDEDDVARIKENRRKQFCSLSFHKREQEKKCLNAEKRKKAREERKQMLLEREKGKERLVGH